ncbi:nucleoside hydrolase isoform X1 [Anabrus simplex]|uniref:nucleoside hydrolase isoform X1 n=1 Tax=Anabrus simplex TaxID=316456 RepID=UPI0035A33D85
MEPFGDAASISQADTSQRFDSRPVPQIIVDVDAGGDDAMALLLLIAAQRQGNIDILGITCVHGNSPVKNVCQNVLRILEAVECYDIPVFLGAEKPLIPIDFPLASVSYQFFGSDGFGDLNLPEAPDRGKVVQQENAVEALSRLTGTSRNKGKVSLICLGPLTNIALAMRTYSDFADNLQALYIMGGNCTGIGNVTSAAEFNFYNDPEAAHIVLSSAVCPITLLPWETSLHAEISMDWRFNVLGKMNNEAVKLLNAVEEKVYTAAQLSVWYPCDAVVAAIFLWPEIIIKKRDCHVSVELHGFRTRGQVVVDHLKNNKNNVTLIEQVNCILLQKQLLWSIEHGIERSSDLKLENKQ